ncbi:GH3 auxin-responsive promoter-domain-containing protein [Lanmaoa asiatica]|nr:GH3 auxin-responsive promoter-domain-containing protein [Lanmaoa asiatica]
MVLHIVRQFVIGYPHDANKLDGFVLLSDHIVEFLGISQDETRENPHQACEVEVGKQYEPILTTRDDLWRYRLGDVLFIVGFDTKGNFPVFKYLGNDRQLTIRAQNIQITHDQLPEAIALGSEDTIQVQEFTTVHDDRALLSIAGFFVELAAPFGPSARRAPQKLRDALVATHSGLQRALEHGRIRLHVS